MAQTDLFISYARLDKSRAEVLVEALKGQGFSIWWDPQIDPGSEYRQSIRNALNESKCVIVLWSATSVESTFVQEEAEIARGRGVLIPVLIDRVTPPIGFGGLQSADLSAWEGSKVLSDEYQKVVRAIRRKIAPEDRQESKNTESLADPKTTETHIVRRAPLSRLVLPVLIAMGLIAGTTFILWPAAAVKTNSVDHLRYRRIVPGSFLMGCTHDCEGDEEPSRTVTISKEFWINETEVTAGSYAQFASQSHRPVPAAAKPGEPQPSDHPVVNVSYWDAREYCRWAGGDLPTEAQWEFAARGGKSDVDLPWGNELTLNDANFGAPERQADGSLKLKPLVSQRGERDRFEYTAPVASFSPNGYGLFDVIGNVQEWCRDAYRIYDTRDTTDPFAAPQTDDDERVVRGCSYLYGAQDCRIVNRSKNPPSASYPDTGFRCVLQGAPR